MKDIETKTCYKCKKDKEVKENFYWSEQHQRYHSWCKSCFRVVFKERRKDPNKHAIYVYRAIERNKQWMLTYLATHPCVDCGEKDSVCLEFDHLRDKVTLICRLVGTGKSLKTIQNEINKCEVVCANCHRRRTARRSKNYKWIERII